MTRATAFSDPSDYLQEVCELRIISWDANRIVLSTPSGRQVVVNAPPGHPRWRALQEFQWNYTVKDLGIDARIRAGLDGYTPIWQTTRIWHQGIHLPMHQPVVTLCPRAEWHNTANHYCTFCHYGLENKSGRLGPFAKCWFCLDTPAWHHGHCCPHNPSAREWNGAPHRLQYQKWNYCRGFQDWLRTLPF